MPLIKKFEDIIAWQEARKLVADIYRLTSSGALAKDYGMRDQIQRAAVPDRIPTSREDQGSDWRFEKIAQNAGMTPDTGKLDT